MVIPLFTWLDDGHRSSGINVRLQLDSNSPVCEWMVVLLSVLTWLQLILLAALLWCVLYRPSEVWDEAPSLDLSDSTYTTLLPLIPSLQCSLRSGTEYSLGM